MRVACSGEEKDVKRNKNLTAFNGLKLASVNGALGQMKQSSGRFLVYARWMQDDENGEICAEGMDELQSTQNTMKKTWERIEI